MGCVWLYLAFETEPHTQELVYADSDLKTRVLLRPRKAASAGGSKSAGSVAAGAENGRAGEVRQLVTPECLG